jgi:hypothetical protein
LYFPKFIAIVLVGEEPLYAEEKRYERKTRLNIHKEDKEKDYGKS